MVVVLQPIAFNSDQVYVNPKCKPSPVIIPIIDLTDSNAKTQIVKACEEFGFFKVVNHRVRPDLLTRLEQEAINFFALPQSLKDKAGPPDPFGYGSKRIGPNGDVGWIEYILLNANLSFTSQNTTAIFQQTSAISRESVEEYIKEMKEMASKVLEMVEEELMIEPKEKLSKLVKVKESDSCLRMNHYPEKEETPLKEEIGFGEHTDPQLISVLRSNDTEGLQIFVKDGTWINVPPDHSSFFVLVGDTLQPLPHDVLVEKSEGFSGSDIRILCKEAAMQPLRRTLASLEDREDIVPEEELPKVGPILPEDIDRALVNTRPSAHLHAHLYDKFNDDYGSQILK